MRATFKDEGLQRELVQQGFVKLPIFDVAQMDELRREFAELRPADGFDPPGGTPTNPTTYHCTFLDTDETYKRAFDRLVRRFFTPVIESLFVDYTLLIGNCYVKQPGRGEFNVHQNWNLTDRLSDITVTIWAPLQDYDPANGSLMVVPGSHKLTRDIAYPRGGYYFSGFVDRVVDEYFEAVPVDAGEAVFFDDSILHGSRENASDRPRRALQVEAIPVESRPAVYLQRPDGDFDVLDGSARFYLETTQAEIDRWPELFDVLRTESNRNRALTEAEFADLLHRGDEVRADLWGITAA